jgi:hypothetical protein
MNFARNHERKLKWAAKILVASLSITASLPAQAEQSHWTARNATRLSSDRPIVLACNQAVNINCQGRCIRSSMGQGKSAAQIERDCEAQCKRSSGC